MKEIRRVSSERGAGECKERHGNREMGTWIFYDGIVNILS